MAFLLLMAYLLLLAYPAVAGLTTIVNTSFIIGFSKNSGVPAVGWRPPYVPLVSCAAAVPDVAVFLSAVFSSLGFMWRESLPWLRSLLLLTYLLLLMLPFVSGIPVILASSDGQTP